MSHHPVVKALEIEGADHAAEQIQRIREHQSRLDLGRHDDANPVAANDDGKEDLPHDRSHAPPGNATRVALQKPEYVGKEDVELQENEQEVEVVVAGGEVEEKVVEPGDS